MEEDFPYRSLYLRRHYRRGVFYPGTAGLGGDEMIERTLLGLPFESTGIIICILIVTFLLGFFLDWLELTLILLPLVSPVVVSLAFDPVWFTVLFAVCLQTSFLTPPVGGALFYLRGIAPPDIDLVGDLSRRCAIYCHTDHWPDSHISVGKSGHLAA